MKTFNRGEEHMTITKARFFSLFLILLLFMPCTVHAGSVRVEVKTILASQKKDFVDPRLQDLTRELQSVFRYSSYEFVDSKNLNLTEGTTARVNLPENRVLNIVSKGKEGNRVILELEIVKNNSRIFNTVIKLRNNSSITIGGPEYRGGYLLFNIFASF